jgi:hypothetical protein
MGIENVIAVPDARTRRNIFAWLAQTPTIVASLFNVLPLPQRQAGGYARFAGKLAILRQQWDFSKEEAG